MNRKTVAAVWAAVLLAPSVAAAQTVDRTGFYGSAGYSVFSPEGSGSAGLGVVNLRGGYQFNRYLGAEIEGAIGVDGGRLSPAAGARRTYELDHLIGVFGVARYPVTERFDVFARGGVAHGKFDGATRIRNTPTRFSDDGALWAAGAGVQYNFDDRNAVRAEYTRYQGEEPADFDVWGLSFVRGF
jgi:opacity protein-like surface antigen